MHIQLPTPYPAQIPILKALLDNETKFIILNGSRQVGKTFIAVEASVYWALSKPNEDIMVVSPTDTQVQKINKQTLKLLSGVPNLIKRSSSSQGGGEIEFSNGSIIRYRAAGSKASLRGYSLSKIILDECAFIDKEVFQLDISPSLSKGNNKKILFTSTPKGKNYFFEMFNKGLMDGKKYKSFKLHYSANPHADLEFIANQKKELHPDFFSQEYDGEFIDSASVFRNIDEVATLRLTPYPVPNDRYTCGIDIGMLTDFTVISVLNQRNEMVYYDRFTGLEAPELIERLLITLNTFKPIYTYLEKNNQGLPILDIIQRRFPNIYGFDTTAISKPDMINKLIAAFSSKSIRIPNDEIIKAELQGFIYEYTSNGKVKFHAANGFHDDIVMSLAITHKCNLDYNQVNSGTVIIPGIILDSPLLDLGVKNEPSSVYVSYDRGRNNINRWL